MIHTKSLSASGEMYITPNAGDYTQAAFLSELHEIIAGQLAQHHRVILNLQHATKIDGNGYLVFSELMKKASGLDVQLQFTNIPDSISETIDNVRNVSDG
ncbi:MAG: STAS domain-containing protein [Bacteroidales bacterium]|nr:STAS domain-containing protein [Bacteroidales bacterium]